MKDRVPTLPGRMKMTMSDGTVQYVTLERADEPTVEGTPLNKASLLTDTTATALGLSGDPTVNDALSLLAANRAEVNEEVAGLMKRNPSTFQKLITGRLI